MGDSEEKLTSAEEREIERILGLIPGEEAAPEPASKPSYARREAPEPPEEEPPEFEGAEEPAEEIEDITDFIEVVEEPKPEAVEELETIEELETVEEIPEEAGELMMEAEEAIPEREAREPEEMEEVEAPPEEPGEKEYSPLDELDALTEHEPASVDIQDISAESFVGEKKTQPLDEPAEDFGEELEGIPEIPERKAGEVKFDTDVEAEVPDLSDLTLKEGEEIPEAADIDIPEIEIGGIPEAEVGPMKAASEEVEELRDEDMPTPLDFDEAPAKRAPAVEEEFEEKIAVPRMDEIEDIVAREEIPGVEEEEEAPPPPKPVQEPRRARVQEREGKAEKEGIDISERDLRKIRRALSLFNPALRRIIKEVILGDQLPLEDTQRLVDLIVSGRPEEDVHAFLEKKLKRKIEIGEEAFPGRRRVLTSRPEYTREGRERQKRLFKITRIFGIAAAVAFLITILSYQFVYKPYMAKKYIAQGVALIREPGDPVTKKMNDYGKAEGLFKYVDENYAKNYVPGYNAFARAYFDKKEYDFALRKLERARAIDPVNIETLNNLGYFYSKIPEAYYNRIRPADSKETRLDTAIKYYRYVLNRKPGDTTALFGIGNAYLAQGQYAKARQYYEDILRVDRKSVVGHSGLLNLYIERDVLPEVLSVHAELVDREMLSDLPSALLAKLAAYYMSKKRTDDTNLRIDYGIQSSRLKDLSDNPYPAVRAVLDALHRRDPNYPPQYVLYAKLSKEQKNLTLMENYLHKALKEEKNYYAALHLLGEYHYLVKEPVKAYQYLNEAVKASLSPPEFTFEDFYYETESLGKTYAYMGNIFYYFFDRVKYRFGDDLEEEELDGQIEQMANYEIAREKYELALSEGYKSPELSYNLGRIYYMKGQYEKALEQWLDLYEDFVTRPEIMFALGNAFYHLDNLEASRGEYLKLISLFEREAEGIKTVQPNREDHLKVFLSLASTYNNLGAIYQRKNNETRSSVSYWKAIDYAKRIEQENEFARVNLARAFKPREEPISPILDENIPYSIDIYRPEMRP